MSKEIIYTEGAPAPIGPYSQAVWAGNTLFVSGQIGINPETGELMDETIEEETIQVMENIQAILEAAELDFGHVVKATIFLFSIDDFARVNDVYARYFDHEFAPARETVEVSQLPKDVNVEISVIAVR